MKKKLIKLATGVGVALLLSSMMCTNVFALTTSRTEPMAITDSDYTYPAFSNGEVLLNKKNGRLPAMGWNSWNAFGSGNNEQLTKAMADQMLELGLDDLGYEYLVLDDGCYLSNRVNGKLSNNEKFPSGFKALSDYAHDRGLKFGMYNDIGTNLCAGSAVGTCGYEDIDAQTYLDWGVDFLKVDNCYYLWDNATFSSGSNTKYTYAPNIRSITVSGEGLNTTLNAVQDGTLLGRGARKDTGNNYVTNIGTFDGTNTGTTPVGEQSGELMFKVNAPEYGTYDIVVNYQSGATAGCGQWLQLAVGDVTDEIRYYDDMLPVASSFTNSPVISVDLEEGENVIRLMNHRRQENTLYSYAALLDGLNKADPDHDVLLSICEWGKTQPQNWGYKVGSSWRVLNDITFAVGSNGNPGTGAWARGGTDSVTSQYSKAVVMDEYAGLDKGWNDPDMFMIGMNGLTMQMNETHMTMWCMMNSPLMLGLDLRRVEVGDELHRIIANKNVIDLNQDPLGIQAKRIYCSLSNNPDTDYVTNVNRTDILAKPLANGDVALSFINVSESADRTKRSVDVDTIIDYIGSKMVNAEEFADAERYYVKDLWTNETYLVSDKTFSVDSLEACDNLTIRISPLYDADSMKSILGDKIEDSYDLLAEKNDGNKILLTAANMAFEESIKAAEEAYETSTSIEELQDVYDELVAAEEEFIAVYKAYDEFGVLLDECNKIKFTSDRYEKNSAWDIFLRVLGEANDIYKFPRELEDIESVSEELITAKNSLSRELGDGFDPIAWYTFEGEDGLKDFTGNSDDIQLVNSGAKITDHNTLGLNLNGENNGYAQLPKGLLADATDFAIATWVKMEEGRSWARLFDFGVSDSNGYMFLCPYNGSSAVYAITPSGAGSEQKITGSALPIGEWAHVAVVQEGNNAKMFINGKVVAAGTITNTPKNNIGSSANYYIGKSMYNADPYFKGEIMDLRVYDKPLTEDEVNSVMSDFDMNSELAPSVSLNSDFYITYEVNDDHDEKTREVSINVVNGSSETKDVNVIVASYNDDGSLMDFKIFEESIKDGENYIFKEILVNDVEIFVWDSLDPITKPIKAAAYTEPEQVWTVVRKNEANVSYTAGNSLTIKTERGDIWNTANGTGTVQNLYLTDVKGDFEAEVTVKFKPSMNYQRGALLAYSGDGNHVTVMRRYHNSYNGNVFMTTMNTNGSAGSEDVYTPDTASETCVLRLTREGSTFRGYFSTDDGKTWNELQTRTHSLLGAMETIKIGFYASNGEQDAASADVVFENFTINGKTVTFNHVE